ncbi:hypothetical protein BDZ91DRAFT_796480 [Kalaharituber pfeilii]|nr:hypothetical protein BDZ91DRAFT_796480 [Kalaharituber pfeilii]
MFGARPVPGTGSLATQPQFSGRQRRPRRSRGKRNSQLQNAPRTVKATCIDWSRDITAPIAISALRWQEAEMEMTPPYSPTPRGTRLSVPDDGAKASTLSPASTASRENEMMAISHSCRRAYEVATRKVLKQAPQEQDNHVLFVGHGDDTKDAGRGFNKILELFFYFLEYDKCPRPLEDRIKKPMAPSDDAELSEANNPIPNDDGTESEIADNDEIAAVGSEQNVPQAPDNDSTEAVSQPPRQLHNYCLTKSAFLRHIQWNQSAKKSFRAFLKYRLPHYTPAAGVTSTCNQEGATLHASQTSASTSRNSTAGTRSSEGRGNFVTLSTPDACLIFPLASFSGTGFYLLTTFVIRAISFPVPGNFIY